MTLDQDGSKFSVEVCGAQLTMLGAVPKDAWYAKMDLSLLEAEPRSGLRWLPPGAPDGVLCARGLVPEPRPSFCLSHR